MKKSSFTILLVFLLLGACSSSSTATESVATKNSAPTKAVATKTAVATLTIVATDTAVPTREAIVAGIENDISARALFSEDFLPASIGMSIHPSGGVETGNDGRARLDLLPEGTIVRLGANSSFTLIEIIIENNQPKTTIELLFGKIFILLNGGSLNVKTSTGVASVSGSLLRVEYDPHKKLLKASCLEGHCTLKNKNGEVVELIADEFSYIEDNQPPVDPKKIYREEIQEWLDEIPELLYFLAELPNPRDYPKQNLGAGYAPTPTPTRRPPDNSYPNP